MKHRELRIVIFLLLLFWCAGFSNSLFSGTGYSGILNIIFDKVYSPVCHQNPSRSIITSSGIFLVCSRCSGIYAGALIISFIYLFKKNIKPVFFIPAAILMGADVFFVIAGIYNYSKTAAFSTGILFGLALFPYILDTIENSFSDNETK